MRDEYCWQQGDICLVQCNPSVGHEFRGIRPALVVQSMKIGRSGGLVTLMIMTSYKGKQWQEDILVKRDAENNLACDSLIKAQHIMSFDRNRLIKRIGIVDASTMSRVKAYLVRHFGIPT